MRPLRLSTKTPMAMVLPSLQTMEPQPGSLLLKQMLDRFALVFDILAMM